MPDNKKPHKGIDADSANNATEEYENSVEMHGKIPNFRDASKRSEATNGVGETAASAEAPSTSTSTPDAPVPDQLRDLKKAADESPTGSVQVLSADGRTLLVGSATIDALLKATEGFQAASEPKADEATARGAQPAAVAPRTQPGNGQAARGPAGVSDGVRDVIAGAAAVVGGAGALVGGLAAAAGEGMRALIPNVSASLPPRLSDYRGHQIEKAVASYEGAVNELWQVPALSKVREAVAEHARVTGISFQDAVAKMGPHGELSGLAQNFHEALRGSEPGMRCRKAMEKALSTWSKQHEHAEKEALNPLQHGDASFVAVRERIATANERLKGATASVPRLEGDDQSHFERINEVMQRVAEMIKRLLNSLRGVVNEDGPQGP